jgi:hypothetical protein
MLDRIVEVFCEVDDFCKAFVPQWEASLLGTGGVSGIPCRGWFHHAILKRSSNRIASWALAMPHSLGGIFQSFDAKFKTK